MTEQLDKIQVGLVQINNAFSGQIYLPYSVACLQSYAEQYCESIERYHFIEHVFKRESIHKIVNHLKDVDIVGLSIYVWNVEISLELARRLKKLKPEITILVGGPQVPDQAKQFMKQHPYIDLCIHNEGEKKFAQFLDIYPKQDYQHLDGASFRTIDSRYMRTTDGSRIKDLNTVPSPFLNGMFDKIMEDNPNESWIGLWETNRGCPFSCTFCDWGSATAAKVHKFDDNRLYLELDWFGENKIEYIFCCDANFGILPRDIDIAKYASKMRHDTGYPVALSVQNTKNATERAYSAQKILADAGLNKGVALSMQSLDEVTLEKIKRTNISLETYFELQARFNNDRVETYSDLILGLPGETYQSFIAGVDTLIKMGQHNRIQFNNLSILPNSEMGDPEYIKQHGMKTVRSKIINIHGSLEELEDDVPEWQELVVATNDTPAELWRKTRSFCWMAAFLHFDKIFQYPLIIAHETSTLSYQDMIEAFMKATDDKESYPLISTIAQFFEGEALNIQQGKPEYVFSEQWLGIFWPADEYVFIQLTVDNQLGDFYQEALSLLSELLLAKDRSYDTRALHEAVTVNRALLSQPFIKENSQLQLHYNIIEFCNAIKSGKKIDLIQNSSKITIDRSGRYYDDIQIWCREVVWWGNKKGAYLYNNLPVETQMAGHY